MCPSKKLKPMLYYSRMEDNTNKENLVTDEVWEKHKYTHGSLCEHCKNRFISESDRAAERRVRRMCGRCLKYTMPYLPCKRSLARGETCGVCGYVRGYDGFSGGRSIRDRY